MGILMSTVMRVTEIDPRTLSWIKQEVADTLDGVRRHLETFVEQGDESGLQACADELQKIRGAVEMVEITGAVMLAREMHAVAVALCEQKVEAKKEAAEVLMRGVIQLPAYLEHLYHGNKDVPLILLPILNDLRAALQKELLTEGAFFFADLNVNKPSLVDRSAERPTWDMRTIAKKLRPAYLSALLGVFRNNDVPKNLKILATVILNLEQACTLQRSEQLFWVSAGVVHALNDNGLELSVAVKLLLGKLDRVIKRVIDSGELLLETDPPVDLLKNMLYYVARSTSNASRVQELKKFFKLDQSLPDSVAISDARDELIGFNANLMANVSEQIKEEMLRIKDDLDIAINANKGDAASLTPVRERLRTVADTLDMLGLQRLGRLARDQEEFLRVLIDQGVTLKDHDVMHVAGALLYIESSLYDLNVKSSAEFLQDVNATDSIQLPEAEFRQLIKIVAAEAVTELAKVKDAFGKYVLDTTQSETLREAPESIDAVRGVLAVLNHERPARILEATRKFIVDEILEKKTPVGESGLDTLANAVGAVDYFLESLLEKAVAPDAGLELAERGLKELGFPTRRINKDFGDALLEQTPVNAKPAASKPNMTLVNTSVLTSEGAAANPDIDNELIAVFLSEAGDELASINANLERWRANRDDRDSLNALVRSFHTLKGAGRIIGATSIGVLAWSVEELLRRALDGRVPANQKTFNLLEQTVVAFGELVQQIKHGNTDPNHSVQELIDLARELRQPAQAVSN